MSTVLAFLGSEPPAWAVAALVGLVLAMYATCWALVIWDRRRAPRARRSRPALPPARRREEVSS